MSVGLIVLLLTTCKVKYSITNNNLLAPVVTQISPDSDKFGIEVTIMGSNFATIPEENVNTGLVEVT